MRKLILPQFSNALLIALLLGLLSGCVSTIVDTAVDTTIAVAKVPFKVAGAAVDVVAGDGKKDKDQDDEPEASSDE